MLGEVLYDSDVDENKRTFAAVFQEITSPLSHCLHYPSIR